MQTEKFQRVAAYCRVSTDKDDQANALDSQQRYFRDYIERNPFWQLTEVYVDEGITGTSTKNDWPLTICWPMPMPALLI